MSNPIEFTGLGPFDSEEQAVICDVVEAVAAAAMPVADSLLAEVRRNVEQLDEMGRLLASYPSSFIEQSLGSKRRTLHSLVDLLSASNLSNFDMFLPNRALVSRNLIMGEVNFYRLLRVVCDEALPPEQAAMLKLRVEGRLCHCLYSRLAEEVLKHIVSDDHSSADIREKAALSLVHLWEQAIYRVSDFFPVLQATWEARRRVPVTLGTLMGTAEMFSLIQAGCDEHFVDYLVRPNHSEDEAAAFREFLFGATTEQLGRMKAEMSGTGKSVIGKEELSAPNMPCDAHTLGGDPALAMFEFFLSRHLQAAARRQADLSGPKRTAEEYVMLHFLEQSVDKEALSVRPPVST
ncbi:MAG: hypothetical protein GY896_07120 [Gammaproteobacteria bacterium]|nr:hypothetical protein [Gammaproteobacteria bacterium]